MDDAEKLLIEVAQTAKHVHGLVLEQGEELRELRGVAYSNKNVIGSLLENDGRNLRYIIDEQINRHEEKKGLSRREIFMLVLTLVGTAVAGLAYFRPTG